MKIHALILVVVAGCLDACATDGGGVRVQARFECDDGAKLSLVFDHAKDAAVLQIAKSKTVELASQHPASGMWFAGDGYELKGAGDTLNYTAPEKTATRCVQAR